MMHPIGFSDKFRYWLPVVFWMCVIFLMSTAEFSSRETSRIIEPIIRFLLPQMSGREVDFIHAIIRKCGHLGEYFVLGLLLFRAFGNRPAERPALTVMLYSVIIIVLYAVSDELHQIFVVGRTPSPVDVGIDTAGGIIGQVFCLLFRRGRDPSP